MSGAEGIVLALGTLGETGQPVLLSQRADAVAAAGQDLVRIALVADIEDQPVMRGIENLVNGNRELDHTETRAQVPAGARNGIDHLGAQFSGEFRHLLVVDGFQIGRNMNRIEKRRMGIFAHAVAPFIPFRVSWNGHPVKDVSPERWGQHWLATRGPFVALRGRAALAGQDGHDFPLSMR